MQTLLRMLTVAGVVCAATMTVVHAQQVPSPTTAAEVPGPAPGTAMTKAYVQTVGRMAYVWGWSLVNMANRLAAFSKAPEPGLLGGVAGRLQRASDADRVYQHQVSASSPARTRTLCTGPVSSRWTRSSIVFQVPDFGDRFWVYALYDARTDEFSKIGKQYGTKPGFYLIVGPNWTGRQPAGITAVVRSSTKVVFAIPRIFMDDTAEDHAAIQPVLSQINFYPLSDFDGKMKTTDWSKLPHFPAPIHRQG